jgi:hypothetical protein
VHPKQCFAVRIRPPRRSATLSVYAVSILGLLSVHDSRRTDIPDVQTSAVLPAESCLGTQVQSSVEVAVIDLAVPGHIDRVPAHKPAYRAGVEGMDEKLHVRGVLARLVQRVGKPLDWHVGDGVEGIEADSLVVLQAPTILVLQRGLRRRQTGSEGVVNQVQPARR